MRTLPLLAFVAFAVAACASQKNVKNAPGPITLAGDRPSSTPRGIEEIKSPAEVEEDLQVVGRPEHAYFAHLQILSETIRGNSCEDEQRRMESVIQDFEGRLSDEARLVANNSRNLSSLLNVEFRTIGFDEGRYQTSFINGKSAAAVPYGISFSVRPNNVVQISYLDKRTDLRLENTPVYTFSVKEIRGACEVTHNVNLFAENSGRFPLE